MSRLFSFVVLLSCFFVLPAPRANAAVLITNGSLTTARIQQAALSIGDNGSVRLNSTAAVSALQTLSMTDTSRLDLSVAKA